MKIYTYYEPVPGISLEDSTRLLLLWKENWKYFGREPVVLNEEIARKHPRFSEIYDKVSRLPTINPKGYDLSCYLRYLAMAVVGGGVMCDYDLFCYADYPFKTRATHTLVSLQHHIPSLVFGTTQAFNRIIQAIFTYELSKKDVSESGIPHVSDMYMFLRGKDWPYKGFETVKNHGDEGWMLAPFVHYANASMQGLQPRWRTIKQLRDWKK
jgi:hypothetical protein